jgi:hypothetical protein
VIYRFTRTGDATFPGTVTVGGFSNVSDERLKKDITTLPAGSLQKLASIRGVSYHWKSNRPDEREHLGVIAQEVEGIAPALVLKDEKGYRSVDYNGLAALFIEAFKESKEQYDAMVKEIRALKAAQAAYAERAEAIEAQLRLLQTVHAGR